MNPVEAEVRRLRDFAVWVLSDIGILDERVVATLETCLASPEPTGAFAEARRQFGGGAHVASSIHHTRQLPEATGFMARLALLDEDANSSASRVISLASDVVAIRAVWEAARARGIEPERLALADWQAVLAELRDVWAENYDRARTRYRDERRHHQMAVSFRQHLR